MLRDAGAASGEHTIRSIATRDRGGRERTAEHEHEHEYEYEYGGRGGRRARRGARVDSDEPKECAISYVLERGVEIVYGTYLDGTDDDRVVLRDPEASGEHTIGSIAHR